jgi:hypothetical protein
MLWTWFGYSAAEVLSSFAQRRMDERIRSRHYQGVSSPSQIRYVNYVEEIVRKGKDHTSPAKILITSVKIHTIPVYKRNTIRISFIIQSLGSIQYDHAKRHGLVSLSRNSMDSAHLDQRNQNEFNFETDGTLVSGDVTIRFFSFDDNCPGPFEFAELGPGARTIRYGSTIGKELCFVTFHTAFHKESRIFPRAEVDGVYDRSTSHFLDDFAISFTCENGDLKTADPTARARIISPPLSEGKQGELPLVKPISLSEAPSDVYGPASEPYAGFSIPYGGTPGQRLMNIQNVFESILKLSSTTHPLHFKRGEIMHDPIKKHKEQSLFMIIYGSAEYAKTSNEDSVLPWRINRGDSLHGFTLGAGDCYGVLPFLLGRDEDPRSFCIRASSASVQVQLYDGCSQSFGLIAVMF